MLPGELSVVKRRINVLFADDDLDNQQIVEFALRNERMNIIFADNGVQAFNLVQSNSVDMVILDIMMPVMDGLKACRKIRRISDVPIIMLTVKGREQDIVDGFNAGADDYIVKPFRPRELVARMNAVMNRSKRQVRNTNGKLAFGNLSVDLEARLVRDCERYIEVTPREFQLLQYLMQHVGVVISKEDLLKNVWGYEEYNGGGKLIETTIRRLRKKVEVDPSHPRYIQTVWGSGYRLGD
jgi:DNA-binding response OmpR family regulator